MNDQLKPYTRKVWLAVGIVTATIIFLGAFSYLLSGLLIIFAGILFGVFLWRVSYYLAAFTKLGQRPALGVVVIVLLAVAASGLYFMGSRITYQVAEFSEQFEIAASRVQAQLQQQRWWKWLEGRQTSSSQILMPDGVMSTARSALLTTISALGGLILVLFLGFYFALQAPLYREGIAKLFPVDARPRTRDVLDETSLTLWWWILGRLVAMVLIGVGSALGLWLLGVPLPVTLGIIAGVLNFIPNIGPLIAAVPAILFALQQGTDTALYVAGFYLLLQFIESYFITPLIDQQQVSLPPGLILSSQLLLGMLAGFLGLLFATPLTATIFVLVRELYVKDTLEATD
jgi:predicted PurR-regulated permease PerM